jgi:hypothetical protein
MGDHIPSIAERTTWGKALSNNIVDSFPRIATITASGVGADCTALINMIRVNSNASRQFNAILEAIEDYIEHSERQNDASLTEKDVEIAKKFTQLEEQNLLIQNLAARLASTSHVTPTSRRVSKDPQPFAGDNKDIAKRQQEYVNWCSQIRLVFLQDGDVFTTDIKKILHVAGLLTGDAQDVNRNDFDTIIDNPHDPTMWKWRSIDAVFASLDIQYRTLDLSREASRDFDNLFMKGKPFQNFIAQFSTLAQKSGKTERQKVEALKLKVSDELQKATAIQINTPGAEAFEEWCSFYQKLYNNQKDYEHLQRRKQDHGYQPRSPLPLPQRTTVTQPPAPAQLPDGDPMILDATRGQRELGRAQERQRRRELNLCFYCGSPEHQVDQCSEKVAKDSKWNPHTGNAISRPQPARSAGPQQQFGAYNRSTPHFSQPRQQYQPPARPTRNPAYQSGFPAYNRIRHIDHGYVEGEVSGSPAPSVADSASIAQEQLKE